MTGRKTKASKAAARETAGKGGVVLLSGGNPQIAKADGDAPVQAYIAAMPGWKSDLGRRLDTLIVRTVPDVRKAVRWNSPFYGSERGWFASFHCFDKYVKVTFLYGAALDPMPPESSKDPNTRYLHVREDLEVDAPPLRHGHRPAAAGVGWDGFECAGRAPRRPRPRCGSGG
jgi:hypothetical protein